MNNSGIGFHNQDQGHVAYSPVGNTDEHANQHKELGDSPEENALYQLLISLCEELGESANPPIKTWQNFCVLANFHKEKN